MRSDHGGTGGTWRTRAEGPTVPAAGRSTPSRCAATGGAFGPIRRETVCFWYTHEREDERECADRRDQGLADVNPGRDEVGDRRDVRLGGEKNHAGPPAVLRPRLRGDSKKGNRAC